MYMLQCNSLNLSHAPLPWLCPQIFSLFTSYSFPADRFISTICLDSTIYDICFSLSSLSFPGGSAGKESACNAGDLGSILGLGRAPGEGKGYPLQYSGLENFMDCIVHGVAKSRTRLSDVHSLTPRWLGSKRMHLQCRRCRFHPWVGKISRRRKWPPTLVFLPVYFYTLV